MKILATSKGEKVEVLVSEDSLPKIEGLKFHINVATGYAQDDRNKKYLHRIVMDARKGEIVDHINRNRTDNRIENLRIVDATGNLMNTPKRKDGKTSEYKGVYLHKPNRWRARFQYRGTVHDGGVYDTPEAAKEAYELIRGRVLSSQ